MTPSDGRTVWWAKDADWYERARVVALVEAHGPAGAVVLDYLTCKAKSQNAGGEVKSGYRAIARATGVDLVTVGHVVSSLVTLCLLDEYNGNGDADQPFTARISGWRSEQDRALAATRKARQRSGS